MEARARFRWTGVRTIVEPMVVRRSRAQWSELLSEFEASGESMGRFCARRRLPIRTFEWWRWRLRRERREGGAREEVRLVAVDVRGSSAPMEVAERASPIRLCVGDLEIGIGVGTDVNYIAALIEALRSRC
jgi:hypothetical protein